MKRSGVADLPLHGGRVPPWLAERMTKLNGFRRLERFARAVDTRLKPEANFEAVIAHESAISPLLDGRSVFDDKPEHRFFVGKNGQRSLF